MAAFQWCLAVLLLLWVAVVQSDTTTDEPAIEFDATTKEPTIEFDDDVPGPYGRLITKEHRKMMRDQFEMTNPTHVNGEELFESDMLLTPKQRQMMADRKATAVLSWRWPNGADGYPLVPYVFKDANVDQEAVKRGIAHWEEHTCIRFKVATDTSASHLQFIKGNGCWSYVGMVYPNGQEISIGDGCSSLGTVAHEIGHAMGFHHEQSRSDRDHWVKIKEANIISGKEGNFQKANDNNYAVTYDYSSDMHYGADYFTKDGKLTMVTVFPLAQELIGSRAGLSHYDKLLANRMYPCITKWLAKCGLSSDPCQNDGYTGANCACVCRKGTSGTKCETITGGYYDSLISGCSKNVTTEGTIISPNYPNNYPANLKCVKWIQAPSACYTVKLKFKTFQLYGKNPFCNNNLCCYFDKLEIRTNNLYDGNVYCDTEISAGQEFTSSNGQMILYFQTRTSSSKGWSADVSFIRSPSCTDTTTTTTPTPTTTTTTTTTPTTTTTTTPTPTTTTTTATTPTTTTTTTPTPTTTTTTTTTPTTTTTTTTTPTTTTTTPTTTTTAASVTDCKQKELIYGGIQWTSPLFGQQNYPLNINCALTRTSSQPRWAYVKLTKFDLEKASNGGSSCWDYVSFTKFYDMDDKEICGSRTGRRLRLPSYNLKATFHSDYSIVASGFNITIKPKSSRCHKLIQTGTTGSTGIIRTPRRTRRTWTRKACEWWIQAPEGKRIQLRFKTIKVSRTCRRSSVLVNRNGDKSYPESSTQKYCGRRIPPTTVSYGNKMNVVFFSNKRRRHHFEARWTVVNNIG